MGGWHSHLFQDEAVEVKPAPQAPTVAVTQSINEASMPAMPNGYNPRRRVSVSAESMNPNDVAKAPKVVHYKNPAARARINHVVKKNLLFRDLDEELLNEVVDAFFEKKVEAGTEIIKQGDSGDYFYIVNSGVFDIFVQSSPDEEPKKVFEAPEGASFGELALMYNAPRAATCTAAVDSEVWALDRMTFRRTLMDTTSRKRKQYEEFLQNINILEDLDAGERHRIADCLEPTTYQTGEVIIRQGDPGDSFYIIESGEASVRQSKDGKEEIELSVLKAGQYFGEMALLTQQTRAASVVALSHCKVVSIEKSAFIRLLGPCEDILRRNMEHYHTYEKKLQEMEATA